MGLTRIRAQQISDIDYKQATRVISLDDVNLSGGAPSVVDGVSLVAGDRVLVNGQQNAAQNGIYRVQTLGQGENGTWVRTTDANQNGEIQSGMVVMVTEGDEYADTPWKLVTNGVIVVGETELFFEENYSRAFGTVVANLVSVVANTVSDTIMLEAGNNISIIGNNSTKSVTIAVDGISTDNISNGTSNLEIATANGNITAAVNGTSVLTITEVGANVNGYVTTSGNISGGNIDTPGDITSIGNVSANFFIGNGSQLTGISASTDSIFSGDSNVDIASANANITMSVAGVSNVVVVDTSGITVLGNTTANTGNFDILSVQTGVSTDLVPTANITYDLGTSANRWRDIYLANSTIYLGNAQISANATSLILSNPQGAQTVFSGTTADLDVDTVTATGNISGGNLSGTLISGTLTTASQPNITEVGTLTSLTVSGNITAANLIAAQLTSTVGNIVISTTASNASVVLLPNGTGVVDAGSRPVRSSYLPLTANDLTTKSYVDEVAEGLKVSPAAHAATTADLSATYFNGANNDGIGATLTSTVDGEFGPIDGVSDWSTSPPTTGVLVKNQTNAFENGRYNVTQLGNVSAPWILTRCIYCDESDEIPGSYVFVTQGNLYAGTGWVALVEDPATFQVGVGNINYVQFSGAGTYTAGTGLTLDGTQFSVNNTQTQITEVGTLTSLSVSGNITATGNIEGNFFIGNGIPKTTVSSSPPSEPEQGDIWINSDTAVQLIYFDDGNSNQWAEMEAFQSFSTIVEADFSAVNQDIIPSANITYDLGNATHRWRDIYLANSTIYLGNAEISAQGSNLILPTTVQIGTAVLDASSGNLSLPENIEATTLQVSGNVNAGNISAEGQITVTGNISCGNLSGILSNCTVDGTVSVGYLSIPQNSQSAAYTLVAADSGKHILHPSADTTARTFTIPANSSVPYPIGTAITFVNQNGAGVVTIAITTDTMRLAGDGTTGSRTLAANGVATAIKLTSTEWIISGVGLT